LDEEIARKLQEEEMDEDKLRKKLLEEEVLFACSVVCFEG